MKKRFLFKLGTVYLLLFTLFWIGVTILESYIDFVEPTGFRIWAKMFVGYVLLRYLIVQKIESHKLILEPDSEKNRRKIVLWAIAPLWILALFLFLPFVVYNPIRSDGGYVVLFVAETILFYVFFFNAFLRKYKDFNIKFTGDKP